LSGWHIALGQAAEGIGDEDHNTAKYSFLNKGIGRNKNGCSAVSVYCTFDNAVSVTVCEHTHGSH